MAKTAIIINGIAAEIDSIFFLRKAFVRWGYQVEVVETLSGKVNLDKVSLNDPEVIVGFSLGGLVMGRIACEYPRAKLIFIATGGRVDPALGLLKVLVKLMKKKWVLTVAKKVLDWPEDVLVAVYKYLNPPPDKSVEKAYEEDMRKNIRYFRTVKMDKWREVVDFISSINNCDNLKTLENKCLIFAGRNDGLMPLYLGEEMKKLIKNSQLCVTEGAHFNVLSEDNLETIKKFL